MAIKKKHVNKKPSRVLSAREPKPFRVLRAGSKSPYVIVCDHASNKVPASLKGMGLKKSDLQKHIGWDPGTADIGRYLSQKLNAPAILAQYSRLVVDLNRGHTNKDCMRAVSDHIVVPANRGLSRQQKKQRLDEIYWPYHDAVDRVVRRAMTAGNIPFLLSIHSFTPEMDGFKRPWHIGILWNSEEKIGKRLVKNLRALDRKIVVGENEPYSLKKIKLDKHTIQRHAEDRGLPYVIVEFRQDLVNTRAKAEKWAKIFLAAISPILEDPASYSNRRVKR